MEGAERGAGSERIERFRVLYDEAYPRIVAYCMRRTRNREDALDAVSETFATVWRRLDDIPTDERRLPWVYGVARRVLANQYRSRERRSRLEQRLMTERASAGVDPAFDLVHEALENLRPADREILTMAAWDDLDNDEIAAVLGVTAAGVAVKAHRARKRLARELGRLGAGPVGTEHRDWVKSEERSRTLNRVNGTNPGPGEEPPP
jgi:RNA polymerase sigma-70 factor (ECF subfamily)